MTKIDRYQGWINRSNYGAVNDHQKNECIIEFKRIPKEKKDKLLNACLNILNDEEDDDFCFDYTENFNKIDANTLKVTDTHTQIDMDGTKIRIILTPPNTEPYTFMYDITGIRFTKYRYMPEED